MLLFRHSWVPTIVNACSYVGTEHRMPANVKQNCQSLFDFTKEVITRNERQNQKKRSATIDFEQQWWRLGGWKSFQSSRPTHGKKLLTLTCVSPTQTASLFCPLFPIDARKGSIQQGRLLFN